MAKAKVISFGMRTDNPFAKLLQTITLAAKQRSRKRIPGVK